MPAKAASSSPRNPDCRLRGNEWKWCPGSAAACKSLPFLAHRDRMMSRKQKGSVSTETFDDFLADQGMLQACEDHAIKEMVAEQLAQAMQKQGLTKMQMAARMRTSRRQLDRLFDPTVPFVTLDTLRRAAHAV